MAKKKAARKTPAAKKKVPTKKKAAKKKAARRKPEVELVGRVACAKHFGIAPATLRFWMESPDFPDCSAGHDLAAIRRWRDENGRKGSEPKESAEDSQRVLIKKRTEFAKMKQAELKTKRDEIALKRDEGELAWRRSLDLAFATVATESRDGHELIVDTLPSTAGVPKKYQEELRQAMRAAFESLQQQIHASVATQLQSLDEQQTQRPNAD